MQNHREGTKRQKKDTKPMIDPESAVSQPPAQQQIPK